VTDEPSDASETAHDVQFSDDYVIHFLASLDCLVKTSLNIRLMAIDKVDYPLDCIAHFITLGLERAQLVRAANTGSQNRERPEN
jgi:hypothetical protein